MAKSSLASKLTTSGAAAAFIFATFSNMPQPSAMGVCVGPFCVAVPVPGQRQNARPQSAPRHGAVPTPAASSPSTTSNAPSAADSNAVLAALAPPNAQQTAVLKDIYPSKTLGAVGVVDDFDEIGKTSASDQDRDYTAGITTIINLINDAEKAGKIPKSTDISEHAIIDSLTDALKGAKLARFETFLGENWSAERLRKMILDRAANEVQARFEGAKGEKIAMADLDSILKKSAEEVYVRLFETSEMLAATRGATWFVERLYQTQGDQVSEDMRESAEQWVEQASLAGAADVEKALRRDTSRKVFAYRYRAQRIVFDCLSENVEDISKSQSGGIAPPAEIAQRIAQIEHDQCATWVSAQLLDKDGKVKDQEPMPLRVIWTQDGAKDDDASLYGPAADQG